MCATTRALLVPADDWERGAVWIVGGSGRVQNSNTFVPRPPYGYLSLLFSNALMPSSLADLIEPLSCSPINSFNIPVDPPRTHTSHEPPLKLDLCRPPHSSSPSLSPADARPVSVPRFPFWRLERVPQRFPLNKEPVDDRSDEFRREGEATGAGEGFDVDELRGREACDLPKGRGEGGAR